MANRDAGKSAARAIVARAEQAAAWLSLDGRLRPRSWWALAPGPAALLLTMAFPARWLGYIGYVYLLLALACYLWLRLAGPRLRLGRRLLSSLSQVGDELEEQWEIVNAAPLPLPWVELADASTMPGYHARRAVSLAPGERLTWKTTARCERRGVYQIGPLAARAGDPLGLFVFAWRERATRTVVIYPPLVRLPPLALPRGQRGGLARADMLQIATTPSVGGVRDYAPGDPPSRIHWPHVARHGRLVIKEFDQEQAGALWVVLDLCAAAYADVDVAAPAADDSRPRYGQSSVAEAAPTAVRPASAADLAIILACSLAAAALAEGRRVGLLADDGRRRVVWPGGGQQQLWRFLGELVDAAPAGPHPLGELLAGGLPARAGETSGAAMAIITPDMAAGWIGGLVAALRGRRAGALALLVADDARRAAPLTAALAQIAVPAQTFALGDALPLANPPRQRVRARVSPLGRVVREAGR